MAAWFVDDITFKGDGVESLPVPAPGAICSQGRSSQKITVAYADHDEVDGAGNAFSMSPGHVRTAEVDVDLPEKGHEPGAAGGKGAVPVAERGVECALLDPDAMHEGDEQQRH